jgi:hypothetical protein
MSLALSPSVRTHTRHNKPLVLDFNGGQISSDGGLLFLQQVAESLQLFEQMTACIHDPRVPEQIIHSQRDLLAQRILTLACGYEEVNDHFFFRKDASVLTAVKGQPDSEAPLGSPSTLSRLENRITASENWSLQKLFVEFFIQSFDPKFPPDELLLDFDATNDSVHGNQIGEAFHGYYEEHCFLPLYVFCGDQILCALLRSPKRGQAHGSLAVFDYLVKRLRQVFPNTKIIFRGDAGFYKDSLLRYCERHGLYYIVGYSSNSVLKSLSENIVTATHLFFRDQLPEQRVALRLFHEYSYQAQTWGAPRRVIVNAERLPDGSNPDGKENTRYIVTNLEGVPQHLYENIYCARGDRENRIKEQQQMLFADRTSCHEFQANQFR